MSWAPVSSGGPTAVVSGAPSPPGVETPASEPGYTDRRPGSVPMRPLALGEILDGAMALLRQAPAATLGLATIVMAIQTVLTIPLQWLSSRFTFTLFDVGGDSIDPLLGLLGFGLTTMVTGVIATLCGSVVSGFTAVAVGASSLGRPVTMAGVWQQTRPRLWALVGLALSVSLAQLFGTGVLFVGWFFVVAVSAVAVPALMLERVGVFRAIARSWELTISSFFRVLGIRLLAMLVGSVLGGIMGLPFAVAGQLLLVNGGVEPSDGQLLLAVFLVALGTMVGAILSAPFLGAVDAMLYIDRRMRAEGLDLELRYRAKTTPEQPAMAPGGA